MLISLLATALTLSLPALGPHAGAVTDTITTGHPVLRKQALRFGADTTEVFVERDGNRRLVNTSVEEITKTADGILVVFVGTGRGGVSIDSVTVSPTTFAPIRHVEAFPGKHARYEFANGRLTGTSTDSTGSHRVDSPIRAGLFDFSVMQQVTGLLPLAAGYEAVVLTYDVAQMKEKPVKFTVVGQERLTVKGAEVTAWKTVMDLGTHQVTRWIDVTTRRDVKFELTLPNMHMLGFPK